ncbi:E3 ubiquitin-protein ligase TRIM39-like [Megalobrama amblycephala]|uniref:E3 ubiquitin-protein ligase TRIM39-like n=1 Tax=Megalobrama amblycephala TaxID=75352 RepID=UPI00201423DF|nr:E3 ubiquitin-protein ligase TRIM39-like [Megalobrama amblycephala]
MTSLLKILSDNLRPHLILTNKIKEEKRAMAESSPKQSDARRKSVNKPLTTLSSSSGPLSEELQCSICLDVFTDPVSTPCGHNFCKSCLNQCWNNIQIYSCPLCKETFKRRPNLKINTALREVVLLFKGNSGQSKSEVLCDICDDIKMKALKMCLECQISYCQTHLEPHQRVPKLKKHKLIDPVEKLEDYICQKHEKPLELFCRDDQTCVCLLCAVTDHKTHNTVSVEEESRERKSQLMKIQTDMQQMIQDRMKRIQDLKCSAKLRKEVLKKEKAESIELFTDLIRSIERCQSELLEMMEQKQKAAEKQAEELIKALEQEITELKRRDTELEQLSHTEDHLHLLQIYPSLSRPAHTSSCSEISLSDTHVSVETLMRFLTQLKETLDEKLSKTVSTELKMMQRYAVDVTLDPDTASPYLILSDDGKQVACGDIELKLKNNPKRFDTCPCVLAKEGFSSGRFYFEVQVKRKTDWDLGVARESINRKGMIIAVPEDGYWAVALRDENQYEAYESPSVFLSLRVNPQVVGVFVDYEEGLVSFYDVESRSHIYSFTGQTFTEKLFPIFSPYNNKKGENAAPLIISHQIK